MHPANRRSLAHVVIHPSPPLWGGNAIFHLSRMRLALLGVRGGGDGGQCHLPATVLLGNTPPPSTTPSSLSSWHTVTLRARCPPLEGVPSGGSWPWGRAGAWALSVCQEDCGDGPLMATPPPRTVLSSRRGRRGDKVAPLRVDGAGQRACSRQWASLGRVLSLGRGGLPAQSRALLYFVEGLFDLGAGMWKTGRFHPVLGAPRASGGDEDG